MLFVDLDKLKIVKDYRPETFEYDIEFKDWSLLSLQTNAAEKVSHIFDGRDGSQLSASYVFNVAAPDVEEPEESFLTLVNILLATFFNYFCLDAGRKRERRLDVPAKLSNVNCSRALLKKAVNSLTVRDRFNITIKWNDLFFLLVDSKDINEEEIEFIHDIDELENTKEESTNVA